MAMTTLPPALAGLAAFEQFIIYRADRDASTGKIAKRPVNACGQPINAHDPKQWMTANIALNAATSLGDGYGVGFTFTANDPYFFLDIDGALINAAWSPLANTMLQAFAGCGVEVSTSGTGLHIIGRGTFPAHSTKNIACGLELYTEKRFCALTGTHASGNVDHVITPELAAWLVEYYFKPKAGGSGQDDWTAAPVADWRGPRDDDELIRRACNSLSARSAFKGGASFADLWSGNEDALSRAFPSGTTDDFDRSSADMALASHLAFWTGRDCERMKTLMLRSKLVRDKWTDRPEYLETTVVEACRLNRDVCQDKAPVAGLTGNGADVDVGNGRRVSTRLEFPHTEPTGKIKNVAENLAAMLAHIGVTVRRNLITRQPEISAVIPFKTFDDARAYVLSMAGHFKFPREGIDDHIRLIASQREYNPVAEWMRSIPWDHRSRLSDFYATLVPANGVDEPKLLDGTPLRHILMRRFLVAMVAAITCSDSLGFKMPGMLVLQGEGGRRKSDWAFNLLPPELRRYIKTEFQPKHLDDKDVVATVIEHVLVEFAEFDGLVRASDAATLKAFLTTRVDSFRHPYDRAVSHHPRRTVFIGTVNESAYLRDPTGNRRFWTIAIDAAIPDHGINLQQLYAEAIYLLDAGERHWLEGQELDALHDSNDDHTGADPIEELLAVRLDWNADPSQWAWKTVTEILSDVGVSHPTRTQTIDAGRALGRRNVAKRTAHGKIRMRLVPPRRSSFPVLSQPHHAPGMPPPEKPRIH